MRDASLVERAPALRQAFWKNRKNGAYIAVELDDARPDGPTVVRATPPLPPMVVTPTMLGRDSPLNFLPVSAENAAKLRDALHAGVLEEVKETNEAAALGRLGNALNQALGDPWGVAR